MANKDLKEIIGNDSILDDETSLEEYSHDTSFVPRIRPRCVVKLKHASQVQELVGWANKTMIPLIPVSSGVPHFRGDTVPAVGGAVIVDLSGLKKIARIDRSNRIAMVETGVTFSELIPQLSQAGLRLNLPLMPRANKSIVGSMLDREPVMMPCYQWDSQDPLTCIEVVFGNGDLFRTGSAAGPGTLEEQWKAKQAQVNPMGPGQTDFGQVVQGSQGTLGIATWATIRCEILPKIQKSFLIGDAEYQKLADFVYRILWWKACDECLILNSSDVAEILAKTPKEYEYFKATLPPWLLFFVLAGFDYFPQDKIAYQEKALADEAKRIGLDLGILISDVITNDLLKIFKRPADEPFWKLWRKGACQDIFFMTTLDKVSEFVRVMLDKAEQHDYPTSEIGIYVQPMVQGTSCQCQFSLFYNPDNYREANTIKELYIQAGTALMNAGAFFNRPYGALTDEIFHRDAETTAALRKVKQIFDPNNIMNAGKLCF